MIKLVRIFNIKGFMEKLQVAGQKQVIKKKPKAGCVRYAECKKNHAVKDGGSVVDGCEEFIASDENGGSALTCSCCGCHRNYHRRVEETDQESFGVEEQKEKKERKFRSKVWNDFTWSKDKYKKERATCNHCKEQFYCSSNQGTSRLLKHLLTEKCRAKRNGGDGIENISTQIRNLGNLTPVVMKEKPSVIDLIKLSFDEYGCPTEHWNPSLLNSRKDEILQVYEEVKEKLGEYLNKLSCRFSLDIHHVCDTMILMVHYIDKNWEQKMKIISIIPRENYIQEMKKACLDLKIDKRICSLRHDDDDDEDEIIESWFRQRNSLPFSGLGLECEKFFDKFHVYLVVSIFDPRFKTDEVQRWHEKTLKYLRDVYNEYAKESSEDYKMMDASSDLDLYLHHLKVPAVETFDKLTWWRGNAPFYPTLSRMARDYLAVPIINKIRFQKYFLDEIYDIKHCIEFDDDIKSALMCLRGLMYNQSQS